MLSVAMALGSPQPQGRGARPWSESLGTLHLSYRRGDWQPALLPGKLVCVEMEGTSNRSLPVCFRKTTKLWKRAPGLLES